jgi:TolA-binding protein
MSAMKSIFQILQEKEDQLRTLQGQIEKLRAAAEIVAQEQGTPAATPVPVAASVGKANGEVAAAKKIWP